MKMNAQKKDVQSRFVHWISLYDEFCNIYDDLNTLGVDPYRLTNIISRFESNDMTMKDFKCKVELWMLTSDNVGNVSYRSRSVKSSSSKKSSVSSSVRSARLRELQRQAELSARVDGLKKKQQLQFSQLKLKQEEEELALSTELAVSAAMNQVLDQYEDQDHQLFSHMIYTNFKLLCL